LFVEEEEEEEEEKKVEGVNGLKSIKVK